MTLTDPEISALLALALLCPDLCGADGYPDPRPIGGMPSPAYLWMVAELARRRGMDPWTASFGGGPMGAWRLTEAAGPGCGFRFADLPSVGAFAKAGAWTAEVRERQVRALIRAVAQPVPGAVG